MSLLTYPRQKYLRILLLHIQTKVYLELDLDRLFGAWVEQPKIWNKYMSSFEGSLFGKTNSNSQYSEIFDCMTKMEYQYSVDSVIFFTM